MPTWRKLHVKTTESLDINDMPDDFTRLLWVLLPLGLDREGRGLDYPSWVRSKVFPLREDVTAKMIQDALLWYEERGMLERYRLNGRRYFHIPTWHAYQGETKREKSSDFPGPTPESLTTITRPLHDQCVKRSGSDVDTDVDTDIDVDIEEHAPTAAPQPKPSKPPPARKPPLSEGQREYLGLFGAKRFKTRAQREAIVKLEEEHGSEKLLEAGRWAAERGMSVGKSVAAVRGALPKWGEPKHKGTLPRGRPTREARDPEDYISGEYQDRILR